MSEYFCEIKRGNVVVFSKSTTAISPKKAISNTWYRYADSEGIPSVRIPIFLSQKKKELKCTCREVGPKKPQVKPKPKRIQLDLFDQMLNDTLGTIDENAHRR